MAQSLAEAFRSASIPVPAVDEPPSQVRQRAPSTLSPIERASGHDIHFLQRLERIEGAQVELALTLYRDEELLAEVLRRAALPPSVERLAISLDDDREGPFVVVTRTGRFVTCLGRGMRIDPTVTPLLSRARLDAAASKVERMRERLAAARELERNGGEGVFVQVVKRLLHDPRRFSREDAELLVRFRPLVGHLTRETFRQAARAYADTFPVMPRLRWSRLRSVEEEVLMGFDRASFTIAQLFPLLDHEGLLDAPRTRPFEPNWVWTAAQSVMVGGTYAHLARAVWVVGHHARRLIGDVKAAIPHSAVDVYARELSLAMMQLCSTRVRSEAHKACATSTSVPAWTERVWDGPWLHDLARATAALVSSAVERADALDEVALALGRRQAEALGLSAVSDDVARALLWNDADHAYADGDALTRLAVMLPGLAHARVTDLYAPADVVRRLPRATVEAARAAHQPAMVVALPRPPEAAPVRVTKIGRNDACTCGSGKKYKKCCGRAH